MSKVAVVTAASKGIGAATAVAFAKDGCDVVLNYRSDDGAAKKVASEIEATGQRVVLVKANIFEESGIDRLFETVKKEFGKFDVLVNNAGLPKEPTFGDWTAAGVAESLTANVVSAALCTQAAVPLMPNGGVVLFNSSIYGLNFGGSPSLPLYSMGKAAIINLTQSLAERLAPNNIRCNAVAPGSTKTPNWDGVNPDYVAVSLGMTLQKEWVAAEEIADAFVFLAKTPHITAQTIVIDAGWQKKIRG